MSADTRNWHAVVSTVAALLAIQIPFEFRQTLLGLTNLQWTFVAFALAGAPVLIQNWKRLSGDRLVQAAALFVAVQWAAAVYAPEFHSNALKAAIRFTAGFLIFAVVRGLGSSDRIYRVWAVAAAAAALYGLSEYSGFGAPWLFRDQQFYLSQVQRLCGSFGYPNVAGAYYAMSLPIVLSSTFRPSIKWLVTFALWSALILTFSRGALIAAAIIVLAAGWRAASKALGIGAVAYVLLLPVNPRWFDWFHGGTRYPIGVEYKTPWNKVLLRPAVQDRIPITIRNTGFKRWRAQGWGRVGISYRWLNMETDAFLQTSALVTAIPRDVESGETVEVEAAFQTPSAPGRYVLALELFRGDFDWFSRLGIFPVMIEVDVRPAVERVVDTVDLTHWYRGAEPPETLSAALPRSSLWLAALRMFQDHPFGVGPDNYRLEYGKYLGAQRWDTHVYSNSLYLEILTGSGVFGVLSFGLMLLAIRWRVETACLVVGVFLVHGLMDVFLMTTPIYFAFWMSLGKIEPVKRFGQA